MAYYGYKKKKPYYNGYRKRSNYGYRKKKYGYW